MLSSLSISHADKEVSKKATTSIFIVIAVSFMPLIFGFLSVWEDSQFLPAFLRVFFSGELYFYAISVCGSILMTSQMNSHEGNLRMRILSVIFVIFCAGFMSFYIGQSDVGKSYFANLHGAASIIFLFLAVFLYHRVMVLVNQPPPMPEEVNRERAEKMKQSVDPDYD